MRVIAIDWSGAKVGATKKIWLAEATAGGKLLRLETGRDRDAIAAHLIDEAHRGEPMVHARYMIGTALAGVLIAPSLMGSSYCRPVRLSTTVRVSFGIAEVLPPAHVQRRRVVVAAGIPSRNLGMKARKLFENPARCKG